MSAKTLKTIKNFTEGLLLGGGLILLLGFVFPVFEPRSAIEASEDYLTINYQSINDSAYERGEDVSWGDETEAEIGDMVQFYIEAQNINAAFEAEDFTVKVYLPSFAGGNVRSWARVSTNSLSSTSEDRTYIKIPSSGRLVYQPGSVRITADVDQDGDLDYDGHIWDDSQGRIDEEGINLGAVKGGAATVQISFYAVVAEEIDPKLTIRYEVNNLTRGSGWKDQMSAGGGDTLKFYIEVHNPEIPSAAENTRVWVDFPDQTGGELVSKAFASAENASQVEDAVTINLSENAQLALVSNSTRVTWDPDGDGDEDYHQRLWSADVFAGEGINFGDLYGCNPFILTLTFEAVVQEAAAKEANLSIEKYVRWEGTDDWYESIDKDEHLFDPGERVVYKVIVRNGGDADAGDVRVVDELPDYIKWISGEGEWDSGEWKVRFDLGTVKAGEKKRLDYTAKVFDESDLPPTDRELKNIATLYEGEERIDDDHAQIWINGPEVLAAEVEEPRELPEAGADSLGLILISVGMVITGWGMKRVVVEV